MSRIHLNPLCLTLLKNKVVLITGGAEGIGREAAALFHRYGSKVIVGDINVEAGKALAAELGDNFIFQACDVSSYQQQLDLFRRAQLMYGPVDVAIANAAVNNMMDPLVHLDDIETEPALPEIDINLRGALYTTRLAMYQMQHLGSGGDIILVSSIAGFKETANLTPYVATKHGVIGIMRGLRLTSLEKNIRVNVICPWMTKTRMTSGIAEGWLELGLPSNEPSDIAEAMIICATSNRDKELKHDGGDKPFHGKILYVAGGRTYEIEDKLQALEPMWLGERNSAQLHAGQAYLHNGETDWSGKV